LSGLKKWIDNLGNLFCSSPIVTRVLCNYLNWERLRKYWGIAILVCTSHLKYVFSL
jgi:hypothetical protein